MPSGPGMTDRLGAARAIQNTLSGLTPATPSIVTLPYYPYDVRTGKYRQGSFGEGKYALIPAR